MVKSLKNNNSGVKNAIYIYTHSQFLVATVATE